VFRPNNKPQVGMIYYLLPHYVNFMFPSFWDSDAVIFKAASQAVTTFRPRCVSIWALMMHGHVQMSLRNIAQLFLNLKLKSQISKIETLDFKHGMWYSWQYSDYSPMMISEFPNVRIAHKPTIGPLESMGTISESALASPRACPMPTWQGVPGPSWSYSCETCWRSWQWQISSIDSFLVLFLFFQLPISRNLMQCWKNLEDTWRYQKTIRSHTRSIYGPSIVKKKSQHLWHLQELLPGRSGRTPSSSQKALV